MAIAMTPTQERDFEEKGFVILDGFLDGPEVERLLAAVDEVAARVRESSGLGPEEPFAVRNALAHHEAFLDLVDHPRALPLVVDAIGWNIQIRTSHLDYRPPYPEGAYTHWLKLDPWPWPLRIGRIRRSGPGTASTSCEA